jgi:hypothetical protein
VPLLGTTTAIQSAGFHPVGWSGSFFPPRDLPGCGTLAGLTPFSSGGSGSSLEKPWGCLDVACPTERVHFRCRVRRAWTSSRLCSADQGAFRAGFASAAKALDVELPSGECGRTSVWPIFDRRSGFCLSARWSTFTTTRDVTRRRATICRARPCILRRRADATFASVALSPFNWGESSVNSSAGLDVLHPFRGRDSIP